LTSFKEHFPHLQEILYVYGGVVFAIFSWSMRGFLYQLSSLVLYHNLGEILAVFAYVMAFALIESLVIMTALLTVGLILPRKWFREGFAYKGFIATLVAGVAMIVLQYYLYSLNYEIPPMEVIYLGLGIITILLIALIRVIQNRPALQKFLLSVQGRLQVFIYFYIPLGIVGLAVVFLRNLR
jgi:hypothetical protein